MPPFLFRASLHLSPVSSSTRKRHFGPTDDMRDEALEPADLYDPRLKIVDVVGGTRFTTSGIVEHIYPKNIAILDQSLHQLQNKQGKRRNWKSAPSLMGLGTFQLEGNTFFLPIYHLHSIQQSKLPCSSILKHVKDSTLRGSNFYRFLVEHENIFSLLLSLLWVLIKLE